MRNSQSNVQMKSGSSSQRISSEVNSLLISLSCSLSSMGLWMTFLIIFNLLESSSLMLLSGLRQVLLIILLSFAKFALIGVFVRLLKSRWSGLSDFLAEDFPEVVLQLPILWRLVVLIIRDLFIMLFSLLAITLRLELAVEGSQTKTFPLRPTASQRSSGPPWSSMNLLTHWMSSRLSWHLHLTSLGTQIQEQRYFDLFIDADPVENALKQLEILDELVLLLGAPVDFAHGHSSRVEAVEQLAVDGARAQLLHFGHLQLQSVVDPAHDVRTRHEIPLVHLADFLCHLTTKIDINFPPITSIIFLQKFRQMEDQRDNEFAKPIRSSSVGVKELATLFVKTYEGKSTQEVKEAEAMLAKLSNSEAFQYNIIDLISDSQFMMQVREAAANYTRKCIDVVFEKKNQSLINNTVERFMSVLARHTVPVKLRRFIVGSLQYATIKDTRNIIRVAYSQNLLKLLESTLSSPFDVGKSMLCVLQGLIFLGFPRYDTIYNELFLKTFELYCQLGLASLPYLQSHTNSCVEFLEELMGLLVTCVSREDLGRNQAMTGIYRSARLEKLVFTLLQYVRLNSNQFGLGNQACNPLFGSVTEALKRFAYWRLKGENVVGVRNEEFRKQLQTFMESFYGQLITYVGDKRHHVDDEDERIVVQGILSLYTAFLQFGVFQDFFQKIHQGLLTGVLIPLLQISPQDKDKFSEQPQNAIDNFNILFDATKTKETEGLGIQMQVSSLITAMCKHMHGWLANLIQNLMETLMEGKVSLPERLQWVVLLGLLWHPMRERHGDLQLVKHYFLQQMPKITAQHDNLNMKVQCTLLLMIISRYLALICDRQFTKQCIQCSLQILSQPLPLCPSLPIVAIDILFTSIQSLRVNEFSSSDTANLMRLLIALTPNSHISLRIYDVLLEVFEQTRVRKLIYGVMREEMDDTDSDDEDEEEIHQQMMGLETYQGIAIEAVRVMVNNVARKVQQTQGDGEQEDADDVLAIAKCWNLLREIVCHPETTISSEPFLQAASLEINQLFRFVGEPKTTFDEDVLQYSIWILKRVGHVTPGQMHLYGIFKKVFDKNNKIFDERLFQLIMLFLTKGGSHLYEYPQGLQILIQMATESLFVRIDRQKITQNNPCQGVLILQSLILLLPTTLTNPEWDLAISSLYRRLTANQYIKFTFFKANLVACLALCFLRNPYLKSEQSQIILAKMISEVGCFDTSYPLKIYVVCVCEILKRLEEGVSEKMHALYRTVIGLMVINYERERNRKDQGREAAEEMEVDEEDYQVSLGFVEHEVKNIDEYDYFKRTNAWLRQNKPNLFRQLTNRLASTEAQFLRKLMNIERVADSARQIVKIKR